MTNDHPFVKHPPPWNRNDKGIQDANGDYIRQDPEGLLWGVYSILSPSDLSYQTKEAELFRLVRDTHATIDKYVDAHRKGLLKKLDIDRSIKDVLRHILCFLSVDDMRSVRQYIVE